VVFQYILSNVAWERSFFPARKLELDIAHNNNKFSTHQIITDEISVHESDIQVLSLVWRTLIIGGNSSFNKSNTFISGHFAANSTNKKYWETTTATSLFGKCHTNFQSGTGDRGLLHLTNYTGWNL
jgi:hypothetical protein